MRKHFKLFLMLTAAIIIVLLVAAYWNYTQDDVFITYVFSRNIARGEGFVFNPGERVQGSTTPLWALLMAGVHLFVPPQFILQAGNVLSGVCLWLTCWLALRWTEGYLTRAAQAALVLLIATSPLVYVSLGMETLLYCALLFAAYWAWSRDRRITALLCAAALTWTRADGIVLGGTLGLLAIYDTLRRRQSFRALVLQGVAYVGGIAPWFAFAWLYFGTPLPQTFSAKQSAFQGILWLVDGLGRWQAFYGVYNPLALIGVLLLPVGAWVMWRSDKLRAPVLWAICYFVGYTILNITNFWYYTPLLVTLIAIAVFGGDAVVEAVIKASEHVGSPLRRDGVNDVGVVGVKAGEHIGSPLQRRRVVAGVAVFVVLIVSGFGFVRALDFAPTPTRMYTYQLIGQWIHEHTPPDARIVVVDLGVVGYWAQRYTLDSPGLIVPSMYVRTPTYAVIRFMPDYVVATQAIWLRDITETDWFNTYYRSVVQISTRGDVEFSPMTVYQRRYPLETPTLAYEGLQVPVSCVVDLPANSALPELAQADVVNESQHYVVAHSPFLSGIYPAPVVPASEQLVDPLVINTQMTVGTYHWTTVCGDGMTEGDFAVMPFADHPAVLATDAEWTALGRLRNVALTYGTELWSGADLQVALDFEASDRANGGEDYTLTVQLLNAEGVLVAQNDGYPRADADVRPTSLWRFAETIVDVRELELPPDLPAGEYTLWVAWYDAATGERLLLSDGLDAYVLPVRIHVQFPGGSGLP